MSSDQPTICAEFQLDETGNPEFLTKRYKHYYIKLFIKNSPKNAYLVTYELHESYPDPVREVFGRQDTSGTDNFELRTTSYGDYLIKASVRTKDYVSLLSKMVSEALQESYGDIKNQAIRDALEDIAKH